MFNSPRWNWTSGPFFAKRVPSEWTTADGYTRLVREETRSAAKETDAGPFGGDAEIQRMDRNADADPSCPRRSRRSSFSEWTRRTGADPTWTGRTPSRHSGFRLVKEFPFIFRLCPDLRDRDDHLLPGHPGFQCRARFATRINRDSLAKRWDAPRDIFPTENKGGWPLWGARHKESAWLMHKEWLVVCCFEFRVVLCAECGRWRIRQALLWCKLDVTDWRVAR